MSTDLSTAWAPYERVMRDYFRGKQDATLVVYDNFERDEAPIAYFFREEDQFSPIDHKAVELARGKVLDVGAGSGCHTLALQRRGLDVTTLELLPDLIEIQKQRGVRQVRTGNIFDFSGERYDTILMLMNGIGLGETLAGLEELLERLKLHLRPGGQLLADSCDLRLWDAAGRPDESQLHLPDGRYLGELHIQLEYEGVKGPPFPQLYADPDTLARVAGKTGWACEIVARADPGYLARLTVR